jgi:hypothetical protein
MKHHAPPQFRDCYARLPRRVQKLADKNLELLKRDSGHPSLHFKKVGRFWSARGGRGHPALAVESEGDRVWFWIGTHADYNRMIAT